MSLSLKLGRWEDRDEGEGVERRDHVVLCKNCTSIKYLGMIARHLNSIGQHTQSQSRPELPRLDGKMPLPPSARRLAESACDCAPRLSCDSRFCFPSSLEDKFNPDVCNIKGKSWAANYFKSNFKHDDIEGYLDEYPYLKEDQAPVGDDTVFDERYLEELRKKPSARWAEL